ncbi:MAG: FGGY family carbohydrate kinase [Lachnospiraceae bacterium]|nr:FGGY family carbohydrate kinase [Lachnospiraceae bacterium]
MKESVYVAADIGATGIKLVAAGWDGRELKVRDTYSVRHYPLVKDGRDYVDIETMLRAIREGLERFAERFQLISLGIDTFGNGYGVLDKAGRLLLLPHHYRDRRIDGIMDHLHEHYSDWEMYCEMGNVPIKTRGLLHLLQDVLEASPNIEEGERLLPLPNLLEYLLTGEMCAERTIASVLYMLEKDGQDWNRKVFRELGIPDRLFMLLCEPGEARGRIKSSFSTVEGIAGLPVITVAGHDTEAALLAIPDLNENKAFVSMGTSFVLGARVKEPVVNESSFQSGFKNMRGAFQTYSLCKDVPGFWILERCMERWRQDIPDLNYEMVCEAVKSAPQNFSFINVSDDRFRVSETDILKTISDYCRETGQPEVSGMQQVARCLFESYALCVAWNIGELERITGKHYEQIVALNGGVQNKLLLQMFADAAGISVVAGSPWASACGNLLLQLYGTKAIGTKEELERAAFASCRLETYESRRSLYWQDRMKHITKSGFFGRL